MCGQTALPLWILLESSFPLLHALGTESDLSLRLSVYLFRHYPASIVCLQGLCRSVCFTTLLIAQPLVVFMWSLHAAHSEPNTAGRSRSTLNRIVLAAKGDSANAKSQVWEAKCFPNWANQIRTGDAGAKIPCLTAWR